MPSEIRRRAEPMWCIGLSIPDAVRDMYPTAPEWHREHLVAVAFEAFHDRDDWTAQDLRRVLAAESDSGVRCAQAGRPDPCVSPEDVGVISVVLPAGQAHGAGPARPLGHRTTTLADLTSRP